MDTGEVRSFFDRLAPAWDANQVVEPDKINRLLDAAGIRPGISVLDAGCGTGVLAPFWLERDVSRVLAVDLSPAMIALAKRKEFDPRIEFLCADVEALQPRPEFDAVVFYNCFPHFPDPARLLERMAGWLRPGGRLTVAHSLGLAQLARHHAGPAAHVSREMLSAEALSALMSAWYRVDRSCSEEGIYYVSGTKPDVSGS